MQANSRKAAEYININTGTEEDKAGTETETGGKYKKQNRAKVLITEKTNKLSTI